MQLVAAGSTLRASASQLGSVPPKRSDMFGSVWIDVRGIRFDVALAVLSFGTRQAAHLHMSLGRGWTGAEQKDVVAAGMFRVRSERLRGRTGPTTP